MVTLAISHRGDDFDGTLNHVLHPGQGSLDHGFELGEGLGRLYPIIAHPLETLGHHMLHHSANEGADIHGFAFHPFTAVGAIVVRDPAAIIAIDASDRDGWGHDVFGQIRRQGVVARRHITLLHLGDEALGIATVAGIDEAIDRRCGQGLAQHGEGMPLPLLVQHGVGQILQMHPALGLWVPPPAGGDEMEVGIVLTVATVCVQNDDVATFEPPAAELAIEIVHTADPAAHEGTQQRFGLLIERVTQHGGDGEHGVAIDDATVKHVADLTDPVVDVNFRTAQAQGGFTAHGDEVLALSAIETAVFDIADLFRIATVEHLFHESIVIDTIVTWVLLFKSIPVITEYLFEGIPSWCEF